MASRRRAEEEEEEEEENETKKFRKGKQESHQYTTNY
jgi:hypothetical protein